ncbi:MAG: RNB domain-containing ribonuclease [Treponema sp.]|jgi:exoribonuclease-2|nr:RNB domain-containing ribonuclease [Treponema sp.]
MIYDNALVVYKTKPALVRDHGNDKLTISLQDGQELKIREKDIELLHPGPVTSLSGIDTTLENGVIREAWELILDNGSPAVSLKDLADLLGEYTPVTAFAVYRLLKDGLYFSGSIDAITPRGREEVSTEETKRYGKKRESEERNAFLGRLRLTIKKPDTYPLSPDDARFMQDVEALALCKSAKSRTMREIALSETPEDAHSLLLKTGLWTVNVNPYPRRFNILLSSARSCPASAPAEERRDLRHLLSFAIDSPWSNDPDDAISIETADGMTELYVHIADPASSVEFDSSVEREARDRGATLYIPEGSFRMLCEEALPLFALGLSENSNALTFKMTLGKEGEIIKTDIFPSIVKVQRLTYKEADALIDSGASCVLNAIYSLALINVNRRMAAGAINIKLPEVRISLNDGKPKVEPVIPYRSAVAVRECMLIAGEGAGGWAAERALAFPYILQEVELSGNFPDGMAGSYQLRRCMRPRLLSSRPGRHQGLGLNTYTQVTSPLRRYTDLLAHLQIRSFFRGHPLGADEVSARLGAGEAAVSAVTQAERASRNHWLMVYLNDRKDSVWDAAVLEKKGNYWAVIIPALAFETQTPLGNDVVVNDTVQLILKSVNIPQGQAVFVAS